MGIKYFHRTVFAALLNVVITLFFFEQCAANQPSNRFFLMGSGTLHLKNLRTEGEARIHLLNRDGSFNEKGFDQADQVFGFPTEEKGEHISPRLLFMLSYFSDQVAPGKMVTIESGYRSPDYNKKIRNKGANAAKTSAHIDGMALDFWLEGVDGKELWEMVRAKNCCGVGHYGGKTIHLDAGRPRFWEAATSGTQSKEPDENRHIYLSTNYDRYGRGETIRLSLSGISTFGFGVKPMVHVYAPVDAAQPVARMQIHTNNRSDCILIRDRLASRVLAASLPSGLPSGRYTMKMEFCEKPFARMPSEIFSNEIELIN
jgi:uncharacterized protein YcbK (DUF882 family)